MNYLNSKPGLKILIPFIIGIIFAHYRSVNPLLLILIFLFAFVVLVISLRKKLSRLFSVICLIAFMTVAALCYNIQTEISPDNIQHFTDLPVLVSIEGVIKSPVDALPQKQVFVVQSDSLWILGEKFAITGRALVNLFEFNGKIDYGDRIVVRGALRRPAGERNPGDFDYRKYLAAQNIQALLLINNNQNLMILNHKQGSWLLRTLVYPVRAWIIRVVDGTMSGQPAALLKGLLIGTRGELDKDLLQAFGNVGVIHILSVSGLHVGFVLLGLFYLFKFLRIPDPLRTITVILSLAFYSYLTGASAPVVRSCIMASVIVGGMALQRPTDIVNSISIAALIILIFNPLQLFEASFQLSFTATLGIIFLYSSFKKMMKNHYHRWQEKERKFIISLMDLLLVSLAAQLATLPLTVYYFNRIPLISIAANLLVVPVSGLNIALGFVSVIAALIYWPIGLIYANTNWVLLKFLIWIVQMADKIPFGSFVFYRPSILLICIYVAFLILLVTWEHGLLRRKILLAVIVLCNCAVWQNAFAQQRGLRVTFFDVGQGDAILCEFPDGKTLLIDTGDCSENWDNGEKVLAPYLRREGIRRIDSVVMTHGHSDHIGGLPYLMDHFKINRIVRTRSACGDSMYVRVDSLIQARRVHVRYVTKGDTLAGFGNAQIMVLSPSAHMISLAAEDEDNANFTSLVLKVIYGKHAFLLTGDADVAAEKEMLSYGELLKSDVLKVGHHGSRTSSSRSFCEQVAPTFAVVSVGRWNRFGLPSIPLLNQLRQQGMQVIRTDDQGAAIFYTDGHSLKKIR